MDCCVVCEGTEDLGITLINGQFRLICRRCAQIRQSEAPEATSEADKKLRTVYIPKQ